MATDLRTSRAAGDPYASRCDATWEAVPRQDPVVWGGSGTALKESDLRSYEADGFLAFPRLFSEAESQCFQAEAQRLWRTVDPRAEGVVAEPQSQVVRSIFRVHESNEMFRRVCQDPRLVDAARQLLGSDVYVHQSRINFKPALDGKEFFWHSDFETWHMEDGMPRMRAVSVSVNLTENNEFNGPLMVIRGSHQMYVRCVGQTPKDHYKHSLRKQEYGVPPQQALQLLVDRGEILAPKGPPGSALFFECNTMHGSVGNLSPWPRNNLFIVFNSVENALQEPFGGTPPRPGFLAARDVRPVSQWKQNSQWEVGR